MACMDGWELALLMAACQCPGSSPVETRLIYWGNYTWEGFPADPPVLVEADITGPNPLYVDRNTLLVTGPNGSRIFAARAGVRQLLIMPQSYGVPNLKVSGLDWATTPGTPAYNTPTQSLTIDGILMYVWISADINTGGYTLDVG